MNAEYLFQQDKQYDLEYDTGDKTIQCGRRNDIFKLWLTWRAKVYYGVVMSSRHPLFQIVTLNCVICCNIKIC